MDINEVHLAEISKRKNIKSISNRLCAVILDPPQIGYGKFMNALPFPKIIRDEFENNNRQKFDELLYDALKHDPLQNYFFHVRRLVHGKLSYYDYFNTLINDFNVDENLLYNINCPVLCTTNLGEPTSIDTISILRNKMKEGTLAVYDFGLDDGSLGPQQFGANKIFHSRVYNWLDDRFQFIPLKKPE